MADIVTQLPVKITDGTNTTGITASSALKIDISATGANTTAIKVDGSGVTQPVSGTVTANAGSGTFTVAYGSGNFSVVGTKTNNNAAPGANNIGTLPALANAAAPSWTEGNQVTLSTDLSGNLRVGGTVTATAGSGTFTVSVSNSPTVVSNAGSGTFTVSVSNSPTVTANAGSGTFTVSLSNTPTVTANAGSGTFTVAPVVGAVVTGTITASNSTITYNVANAQGAYVSIHGTYAGVNFNFQASDDSGTTYYPLLAARTDGSANESSSGVLPANTSRAWFVYFGSATNFQIATTAWTSGTANIRITPLANAESLSTMTTVTANAGSGTFTVAGTVTANAGSGTMTVSVSNSPTVVSNAGSGTFTVAYGSGNFAVVGTKTNNNAAPGATNIGTLPALANASAPSWTEGNQVSLSTDLSGNLRVGGTVTAAAGSGTFTVSVSNSPTVVSNAGSGTFTVSVSNSPTVTANAGSGTFTVSLGEITTNIVHLYNTVSAVAAGSTGTITYTVTSGKTLLLKQVYAASSGAPCKVVVQYGSTPTVIATSFYANTAPYVDLKFAQPFTIAASTPVQVVITNNAGAAQDVYAFINGHEQ